ncbi:MAG: hypothetical protein D3910_09615 [Candidatus Electrothrix sp. ATG2]|nr:hypothetical protein [Candidatus Electrothrix sp. ATG2]
MALESVLNSEIGLIVAPAGCGKTHLITEALNVKAEKPYLVLTHTTAGVAALKQRLKSLGVSNRNFVVTTIDGWALHIAKMFPISCDIKATPDNPRVFYPELRRKVNDYIGSGHLAEIIRSSYSRLLVDEYQDCDAQQHALICSLSEAVPTIVFGDQMQCIFNFSGTMPSWDVDVKTKFPVIDELNTPWRWINAGTPKLGQWILSCRNLLLQGASINLLSCPNYVNWTYLSGNRQADIQNQNQAQYRIRNENNPTDSLLVIGDSRNPRSRHKFASLSRGLDVVEPVDLSDITGIASQIDDLDGKRLADHIIISASSMMTGLSRANLNRRMTSIMAGRNRTPATEIELAIKSVIESSSMDSISNLCDVLESSPDTRIFRKGAFSAFKSAVSLSISDPAKTMRQAAEIIREKRRHQGDRRIPSKAIGSTLLLKGLESDHSLILDAGAMNSHNLYVALSRGAKSITVFSSSNVVP